MSRIGDWLGIIYASSNGVLGGKLTKGSDIMSKLHYVADEELGGIEREYEEVGVGAEKGDLIVVTNAGISEYYFRTGDYGKVVRDMFNEYIEVDFRGFGNEVIKDGGVWYVGENGVSEYKTLPPTGRVRIDGKLYEMADRQAEVGEKVIHFFEGKAEDNTVFEVVGVTDDDVRFQDGKYYSVGEDEDDGCIVAINHGAYRVLTPAEPSQNTDVLELIANLAKTVAKQQKEIERLERDRKYANELTAMRLDANTNDIRTFAEEFTEFKADAKKQAEEQVFLNELFLDDIAYLDERTQPDEDSSETIVKPVEKGIRIDVRI